MPNPRNEADAERIRALADALRAITSKGIVAGNLHQNVSTAETFRKWIALLIAGILAAGFGGYTIRTNTKFIEEWGPKLKIMWWMKENGYTNKDVEPIGPIKPPRYE